MHCHADWYAAARAYDRAQRGILLVPFPARPLGPDESFRLVEVAHPRLEAAVVVKANITGEYPTLFYNFEELADSLAPTRADSKKSWQQGEASESSSALLAHRLAQSVKSKLQTQFTSLEWRYIDNLRKQRSQKPPCEWLKETRRWHKDVRVPQLHKSQTEAKRKKPKGVPVYTLKTVEVILEFEASEEDHMF